MSGTDIAYAPTHANTTACSTQRMLLRACYAMPGTDPISPLSGALYWRGLSLRRLGSCTAWAQPSQRWSAIPLRARYALSGTGLAYAALSAHVLCGARYWPRLCCYAMLGTELGYAATRGCGSRYSWP
eukprot:892412-Rhodomonas_salina.2